MKPPPFDYHRPASVREAVTLLAELDDAKIIAGGQSLVPLLSMRLADPAHLVDINAIPELDAIGVRGTDVHVGALARHRDVERSDEAAAVQPLLRQALRLVAHPTIRNRGTSVGSIVHADPSGELTAVLALLGGLVHLVSASGERDVAAADFFLGPLESATRPDEIAIEARFPVAPPRSGSAFVEVARRHGDYAVCGVAAVVEHDQNDQVIRARLGFISVAPTPLVLDVTDAVVDDLLVEFVKAQVKPTGDIHATAEYRRHLAGVLAERSVREARAGMS